MEVSRQFWRPYWGLALKEAERISWLLGLSLLLTSIVSFVFYSDFVKGMAIEIVAKNKGTQLDLLRWWLPFLCVVFCSGFVKRIVSEELENGSWRFHQFLSISPIHVYMVKFAVGLLAACLCVLFAQAAFLVASMDQMVLTWKHVLYPSIRLVSVAGCVWGMLFLAASLGSFRWLCYGVLLLIYHQYKNTIPPFDLVRGEGILEEVGHFPDLTQLGATWLLTASLFGVGLVLVWLQNTTWMRFLYKPMPYKLKLALIGLIFVGATIWGGTLEKKEVDQAEETGLKAFGVVLPAGTRAIETECWLPTGTPESIKQMMMDALPEFEKLVMSMQKYLVDEIPLPKCVIILRPDYEDTKDWHYTYYEEIQTIVIRIAPDEDLEESLGNILANYYLDALIDDRLLDVPIAIEQYGWLAAGLPQYLAPIDPSVYSDEDEMTPAIEWLRSSDLSDWPSVRDAAFVDGHYDSDRILSSSEREMASWALLKACEERYGREWVQKLCYQTLWLGTPESAETSLYEFFRRLNEVFQLVWRARLRSALHKFVHQGGEEAELCAEGAAILETYQKSLKDS